LKQILATAKAQKKQIPHSLGMTTLNERARPFETQGKHAVPLRENLESGVKRRLTEFEALNFAGGGSDAVAESKKRTKLSESGRKVPWGR